MDSVEVVGAVPVVKTGSIEVVDVPVITTGTIEELEAAHVVKTRSIETEHVDGTDPIDSVIVTGPVETDTITEPEMVLNVVVQYRSKNPAVTASPKRLTRIDGESERNKPYKSWKRKSSKDSRDSDREDRGSKRH